jgi:hypothetical protein
VDSLDSLTIGYARVDTRNAQGERRKGFNHVGRVGTTNGMLHSFRVCTTHLQPFKTLGSNLFSVLCSPIFSTERFVGETVLTDAEGVRDIIRSVDDPDGVRRPVKGLENN